MLNGPFNPARLLVVEVEHYWYDTPASVAIWDVQSGTLSEHATLVALNIFFFGKEGLDLSNSQTRSTLTSTYKVISCKAVQNVHLHYLVAQ